MKIEDQVSSADLCKKLMELGVRQESLFYWYPNGKTIIYSRNLPPYSGYLRGYSAFTASELLKMFPQYLNIDGDHRTLLVNKSSNGYIVNYYGHSLEDYFIDNDLANAAARALIWLIENNLLMRVNYE